jgi:hypothetical protein
MEYVMVNHKGSLTMICKELADSYKLKDNDEFEDEDEFQFLLKLNALYLLNDIVKIQQDGNKNNEFCSLV